MTKEKAFELLPRKYHPVAESFGAAFAPADVNWALVVTLLGQLLPELAKLFKRRPVEGAAPAHCPEHVKAHAESLVKKAACLFAEAACLEHCLNCCDEE